SFLCLLLISTSFFFLLLPRRPAPHRSAPFPYTTLFRSHDVARLVRRGLEQDAQRQRLVDVGLAYVEDEGVVAREYFGERRGHARSEEHTSELQSRFDLVCRLLLEKKNKYIIESQIHKQN